MNLRIERLFTDQLASWELAKNNYAALSLVKTKELNVDGIRYKVQFNPARIASSAAKVDNDSIRKRKCFLCPDHLPDAQRGLPFKECYQILVNPFPIFPKHFTIPALRHADQRIKDRFGDMLDLATCAEDYVVFYNGPHCGASAPDHLHFQAGSKGFLPIEQEWKSRIAGKIATYHTATLSYLNDAPRATLLMEATGREDAIALFNIVYDAMERKPGEDEPMMNILLWTENSGWTVCIFPRAKHRPSCYTAAGDANILISPASVDMGGVFITPQEKDFEKLTATDAASILNEVCLNNSEYRKLRQRINERL